MIGFAEALAGFAALVVGYSTVRYLGASHNGLVESREECERAWSNVEVLLERRYDEIGNLVDVAREHVEYEKDVLQRVIDARRRAIKAQNPYDRAEADVVIRESVSELYKLSDEYPNLRADDAFDDLRTKITRLEQRIEDRREFYNESVARYNAGLERFPEAVFASRRGFERRQPFEASEAATSRFDVGARFASRDR
jgi:LemA protein